MTTNYSRGRAFEYEFPKSCKPLQDLSGKVFGRLTVIKRVENKSNRVRWLCHCECGYQTAVIGKSLREGKTKSCGCLRNELARDRMQKRQSPLRNRTHCQKGHEFSPENTGWRGTGHRECKACRSQNARRRYLKRTYGLSLEEFEEMLRKQDYKCAICRCNFKKRCIDHDHKTGEIRGLLCNHCNTGLGRFRDSYETTSAAAGYLARYEWSRIIRDEPPSWTLKRKRQCKTEKK